MGFVYYSNKYRTKLIDEYFSSGVKLYAFCKKKKLPVKTFYRWIDRDSRSNVKKRPRILVTNRHFSFCDKIKACRMRESGRTLKEIASEIGCTKMCVTNWYNTYKTKGEYQLMSRKDLENGSTNELIKLKAENEKLKRELFNKQLQIDAYDAIAQVLKARALSKQRNFLNLTNLEKTKVIDLLRAKYRLNILLDYFNIKYRTYNYNHNRLGEVPKYQEYDSLVLDFIQNRKNICKKKGYREVMLTMGDSPEWTKSISERRIRKVMQDNNLQAYQTKSMKKHNSYKNDGNPPVKNWLYDDKSKKHFFNPENIWEILGTDVTEFHINGFKAYLSPIIDFHDSMVVSFKISQNPNTDLIVGTVEKLLREKGDGGFILHMDQGSVNRSYSMKNVCRDNHILQSMSRKGKSGDNAPTEGFFGRLKQEWFNKTDFTGYDYKRFKKELSKWIVWYNNERHNQKVGGLSPVEYRKMLILRQVV